MDSELRMTLPCIWVPLPIVTQVQVKARPQVTQQGIHAVVVFHIGYLVAEDVGWRFGVGTGVPQTTGREEMFTETGESIDCFSIQYIQVDIIAAGSRHGVGKSYPSASPCRDFLDTEEDLPSPGGK